MKLKIWGRTNSANVRKVIWTAEELALTYESINAGGPFGITDQPYYLEKNPNGLVPLLEDGSFILWESNAIVRYLTAQYGAGSGLYPDNIQTRASADKWMDWTTSALTEPFRFLINAVVRTPEDQRDWEKIRHGVKTVEKLLAIVEDTLSAQSYLSGSTFNMSDIPMGCFIYGWFEMPIERADMPHLRTWYDRLKQRPAYQATVMTPLT